MGVQPGKIRVSPDGTHVWATDLSSPGAPGQILNLNALSGYSMLVTANVDGNDPADIAFSPDSAFMFAPLTGSDKVVALSAASGAPIGSGQDIARGPYSTGGGSAPTGIAVVSEPVSGDLRAYVATSGLTTLKVIDLGSGIVSTVANGGVGPVAVAASNAGDKVFTAGTDGTIRQISTNGNTIVGGSVNQSHSTTIQDLAVTPDGGTLLVAGDDGTTGYIDAYASSPSGLTFINSTTAQLAFTQITVTHDGRTIYAAAGGRTETNGSSDARLLTFNLSDFTTAALAVPPAPASPLNSESTVSQLWGVTTNRTSPVLYATGRGDTGLIPLDEGWALAVTHPTAPDVPTSVQTVSANRAVKVSWTAPVDPGSESITGYDVISSPGGKRCHSASTDTYCWVYGLTNGTPYTFTVTATSDAGTSLATVSSPQTPSAVPYPYTFDLAFFAGTGVSGLPASPGTATAEKLQVPVGLAAAANGDVYIADSWADQVTQVSGATITRIAGNSNGSAGSPALPTAAATAALSNPNAVALGPSGDVYIADTGNHRVSKIDEGILVVVAGTGTSAAVIPGLASSSPLASPRGLAFDLNGDLYIADTGNHQILKVDHATNQLSVFAGTGSAGTATPGSPATASPLQSPRGVAVDAFGNVYIADTGNYQVERVDPETGLLSVVAGSGQKGTPLNGTTPIGNDLGDIYSLAVGPEQALYLADRSNNIVERIDLTAPTAIQVIAGSGLAAAATEVNGIDSDLRQVSGVAVRPDDGKVYISDSGSHRVHQLTPADRVPGPPTGLLAQAGNASTVLTFTTPLYTGGSGVLLNMNPYYYSTDDGVNWSPLPSPGINDSTVTSTITGLGNGTTYAVRVRAMNAEGDGVPSKRVRVTPDVLPQAPVVPTAEAGENSALVKWNPPANSGSVIREYVVSTYLDGVKQSTARFTASTLTTTITGLIGGGAYTFRVEAVNALGVGPASAASNEVKPTGTTTPPTPSPTAEPSPSTSTPGPGPSTSPTATPTPTQSPTTPPKINVDLNLKSGGDLVGSQATINGGGLKGSSEFTLMLHSTPVVLASGVTDEAGSFSAKVIMPAKACISGGLHQLVLSGTAPDGTVVSDTSWIVLDDTCKAQTGSGTKPPAGSVALGSVLFPAVGTALPASAKTVLKTKDGAMKTSTLVTLTGYALTSSKTKTGIAAAQKVALKRAIATRDYLKALGVKAPIKVVGVGGSTAAKPAWQKNNRRVVITVRY
ncbi:fibronectin type III domain-containing protein [Actinoplanes palleronii]|nr:fibronectin type III domain-containing protein [Actinoplanes palleronii]